MRVRFGPFQIDSETRQLFGANGEVHLSPKAFDLLAMLVSERPRAVPKDALQDRIWPTTFVSEANLPLLVSELRAVLGDAAASPRYIRTVPRFGYAFCGSAIDLSRDRSAVACTCFLLIGAEHVPLREGIAVLGRDAEADVKINASGVSRLHARIHLTGVGATVEDLGSKNGTFVRGQRVQTVLPVYDGDEIRLGPVPVTFRAEGPAATTETIQRTSERDGHPERR